jgi:predicted metal-binding membrane protein
VSQSSDPTALERLLAREHIGAVAGLLVLTIISWAWIVPMARDMYGPMTGPSAWMMRTAWDGPHLLLLWAMWAVMMAAMMLPTATPMLLFYGGVLRKSGAPHALRHVYAMAAGYLLVWSLFSVAATMLQRVLSNMLLLTPMMETSSPSVTAALLLIAGIYQLTPLKGGCLRSCRSPLALLMSGRRGARGAFQMGVGHGVSCLGCCWALMLLLFAGGVMNLYVIGALTVFVMIEKVTPFGIYASRAGGALLIALAIWLLASPQG